MAGHDAGTVPYATVTVLRKFIYPMWVAFAASGRTFADALAKPFVDSWESINHKWRSIVLIAMVIVCPYSSLASKAMSPLRKLNGAERLVAGRRRNLPFICLHIEESLDLCRTPVAQMAHHPATPMPADKERTQYR
jgi:amino acid transporter